jgi:hypothetical protein
VIERENKTDRQEKRHTHTKTERYEDRQAGKETASKQTAGKQTGR